MRETLQRALDEHIDKIKWLQERLSNGHMTPEQVGIKLRSRSIELGSIACMPFRECCIDVHHIATMSMSDGWF